MMRARINPLLPCTRFFSAGRPLSGLVNLLMQVTLVLWPLAVHSARKFHEERVVNRLLHEFGDTYPVPLQRAKLGKRFRGAVSAEEIVFGRLRGSRRRAA